MRDETRAYQDHFDCMTDAQGKHASMDSTSGLEAPGDDRAGAEVTSQSLAVRVRAGLSLSVDEAEALTLSILRRAPEESATEDGIWQLIAERGETREELCGFIRAMHRDAAALALPRDVIDVCGTGGSGYSRFNVSTTSAFVVAGSGVPVVKQASLGTRGNGSLDLLNALHVNTRLATEQYCTVFYETGLTILDVSRVHPNGWRLAHLQGTIGPKSLLRYVFPLCNPIRPRFQLIGAPEPRIVRMLSDCWRDLELGERAVVVTGDPGIDEISTSGPSLIVDAVLGESRIRYFHPHDIGVPRTAYEDLPTGDAATNAKYFLSVLNDGRPASLCRLVALNAAAAIMCAGRVDSLEDGYEMALNSIVSGAAKRKFDEYTAVSSQLGSV